RRGRHRAHWAVAIGSVEDRHPPSGPTRSRRRGPAARRWCRGHVRCVRAGRPHPRSSRRPRPERRTQHDGRRPGPDLGGYVRHGGLCDGAGWAGLGRGSSRLRRPRDHLGRRAHLDMRDGQLPLRLIGSSPYRNQGPRSRLASPPKRHLVGPATGPTATDALPSVPSTPVGSGVPEFREGCMDTGDTAWLLMSTALVMIMLPGLALFYGGLVRRKNVLSTIMHSFFGLALVSMVWVIVGFSLAFGPDVGGFGLIGGLDHVLFNGVGLEPSTTYATTVPFVLFAAFQLMFAAITPALITGAFAERKRFGAFVLFTILWSILVYAPLSHWVWSVDGWLYKLGALDFAGGTVVHISSGVSALIVALLIGRRRLNGSGTEPHDVPMVVLGAGLLWFGWFGFNAGSALTAGGLAASAFTVTNVAAAAATITWVLASYAHTQKVSVVGAACGAVAGLVAITPASGFVTPAGA